MLRTKTSCTGIMCHTHRYYTTANECQLVKFQEVSLINGYAGKEFELRKILKWDHSQPVECGNAFIPIDKWTLGSLCLRIKRLNFCLKRHIWCILHEVYIPKSIRAYNKLSTSDSCCRDSVNDKFACGNISSPKDQHHCSFVFYGKHAINWLIVGIP